MTSGTKVRATSADNFRSVVLVHAKTWARDLYEIAFVLSRKRRIGLETSNVVFFSETVGQNIMVRR